MPAYGTAQEIGRYLGAGSARTARRFVAELRAKGLPVYRFGRNIRFKFGDVDALLRESVEE